MFINLFVTCVFAAGFYGRGIEDIGLENAGQYLGETYGKSIVYIWALGLLAAGQSATMTGCYTGQFVMEGYLNIRVSPFLRVLITRLVAVVPTLIVAFLSNTSTDLDVLNQWLNLLQSVQLPFALLPVLAFNASEKVMGKFANSRVLNAATAFISVLVTVVNLAAVYSFSDAVLTGASAIWWVLAVFVAVLYCSFILYLLVYATGCCGLLPSQLSYYREATLELPVDGTYESPIGTPGRMIRMDTLSSMSSGKGALQEQEPLLSHDGIHPVASAPEGNNDEEGQA